MDNIGIEEGNKFIKIYKEFLNFVGSKYNLITKKDLEDYSRESLYELLIFLRNKIFAQDKDKISGYISEFLKNFKDNLSENEIEIINNWSKGVLSDFFIVSYFKDYSIFYDIKKEKSYSILGATESICNILPVNILTKTLLLPYGDKIICDGLFESKNINFGGSIIRSFKEDFEKSKLKYGGIITNLNEKVEVITKDKQELGMLEYYLNSESRMREYWDEICDLWNKSNRHKIIYYLGRGKLTSKKVKKKFLELGFGGVFVGIFEDTVIASASSEKELNKILEEIVPKEKRDWIYVFKIAKKKMRSS